jgi:hypothetical protein
MPSWGPTSSKRHLLRSRPWQWVRLRHHGRATTPIGSLFAASDSVAARWAISMSAWSNSTSSIGLVSSPSSLDTAGDAISLRNYQLTASSPATTVAPT